MKLTGIIIPSILSVPVDCPATKEKAGVCGAVNPRDGLESDTFLYYLKWLLREFRTRKKIVLVLDNATSHKSNRVAEFVSKHKTGGNCYFFLLIHLR